MATFQKCSCFGKLDSCGKFAGFSVNVPLQFFTVNNLNSIFEVFCGILSYLATVLRQWSLPGGGRLDKRPNFANKYRA
jgi:hypothetical protein